MACNTCGSGANPFPVNIIDPMAPNYVNVCTGVTIDLLQQWLSKLNRVIDLSAWDNIPIPKQEILDMINLVEQYISAKQLDPNTCDFYDQLPSIQTVIVSIIKANLSI